MIGPFDREIANSGLFHDFIGKSGDTFVKNQQVAMYDDDTVTATSDANLNIGCVEDGGTGDGVKRFRVRLNGQSIKAMIGNGTVTRGKLAVNTGTAGKVTDTGATPDARTIVGRFLVSSAVDGDWVAVLVP
jgi:hypothetical protein